MKKSKQVFIQLEGGCIAALKLPRGVHAIVIDYDEPRKDEATYCTGCKWAREPHRHWEQLNSDSGW